MAKGFVSGIVWGAVVSAIGLATASQMGGRVDLGAPEAVTGAAEDLPREPQTAVVAPTATETAAPAPGDAPERSPAPLAVAPDTGAPPEADTSPAATPEAGTLEDDRIAPPEVGDAPQPAPAPEEPVAPPAVSEAPATPSGDAAPNVVAEGAASAARAEAPAPEMPAETPAESPAETPAETAATAPETATLATPGDVVAATAQTSAPEVPAAPATEPAPVPPAPQPVIELSDSVEGIRLPVPDIDEVSPGSAQPLAPADDARPAIQANAEPFQWDGTAPLLSILLFDQGATRVPPERLRGFPIPLTVAVNPLAPDAADVTLAYRAAGVEVVALAPLPEGATPADVEVAFQTYFVAVPEAVAVLDTPEGRFQENRPRAAQIAEILADTGHGLITYKRGLNAALQLAQQDGVPSASVLRVFDEGDRNAAAMKRFLDQAAFQAAVDGTAIVTGFAREEVLSALSEWALGNRAATVTLAPVSGVLNTQP